MCYENKKMRNSSIECLKVGAMFFIIFAHTTSSASEINLIEPIEDIQRVVLEMILYSLGTMGNMIFFVCSAWFLLESKKVDSKKWLRMFFNIWTVSVLILSLVYIFGGRTSLKIVVKSFFPTICGNNWYMTCYLIFYLVHPVLNIMINMMNQQRLLRAVLLMSTLYIGFDYIDGDLFFPSQLILWATIYLIMAYIKKYLSVLSSDRKVNLMLLFGGAIGHIGTFLAVDFLKLRIEFLEDKLRLGTANCNPFLILIAIALFNLVKNIYFENCIINYISKLSLLIYVFHENIILKTYYRPIVVNYMYSHCGEQYILLWLGLLAILIFLTSAIVSFIYEKTLQRLVNALGERVYLHLLNVYQKIELQIMKLH